MLFQTMQQGSQGTTQVPEDYPFFEPDSVRPPRYFDDPAYPKMHFIERRFAGDWTNWWAPNRACSEAMLRAAGGAVVTVASTRARQSEPDTESYAASKGGLVALTHALAASLGPDVRVNCISPGWIDVGGEALRPEDHAQHPEGRVGRPEDVAALTAWLLGPESGFVTGAEFVIDGGMTM